MSGPPATGGPGGDAAAGSATHEGPLHLVLSRTFALVSSFGLAIVLLGFLLLLTWLGTLEQQHTSLYEVQKKYFESVFVTTRIGPVPLVLPGVYLLLVLLGLNLVAGGLVRIRKSTATAGVLVTHVGILLLLAGGLVEYQYSTKGQTTLMEGERSDEYQSYFEWEVAVTDGDAEGEVTEWVIPGSQFVDQARDGRAVFTSEELPFDLVLEHFTPNADVRPVRPGATGPTVAEGFGIVALPREIQAERDSAALVATVVEEGTGAEHRSLLWARHLVPWSVEVGGTRWTVDLTRRRWQLPFTVRLDDFRKVDHPGTSTPQSFESDVTKLEAGTEQPVTIRMNEPLRDRGFTLYQSGWQKPTPRSGGRFFSTFAVVRNPADQVPLFACIVIGAGLLIHFTRKLVRHVRSQIRRPS